MLALALSCEGRATGPRYRGEPLAVITGRMTADRNISVVGDVRLAIAWFTSSELAAAQPDAVHTESLIYEPVFPASFSFGLHELPAVRGSVAAPGGVQAAAVGIVMAYDDRNRNGVLDTYRAGEQPLDSVLGSSLGRLGPTLDPTGFVVVLMAEVGQPPMLPMLRLGLNLLRTGGTVAGFEQAVPIHLDGARELNLFICRELFDVNRSAACLDSLPRADGGLTDGGVDGGPVGAPDAGLLIQVTGSVGLSNSMRNAILTVTVGGANRPDASVELNGVRLAWDAPRGQFRLMSGAPTSSVVAGGANALQVSATNAVPITLNFFMPGDFALTAPAFNATLQSNTAFDVAWTDSKDAGGYLVNVYRSSPFGSILEQAAAASPVTLPGVAYQGSATLTVQASLPAQPGPNASFVFGYVNQSIPVTFQ